MKLFILLLAVTALKADPDFQGRISSGFRAKPGSIKCYVTLDIEFEEIKRTCGGCLLSKRKILTSANCVNTLEDGVSNKIKFAFGTSKRFQRGYSVEEITLHPEYDPAKRGSTADLAVITLNKDVRLTSAIQPAVPSKEATADAYVGEKLLVCGFGNIDNDKKKPRTLQCTRLKVIKAEECAPPESESTTTAAGATTTAAGATTTAAGATTTAAGATTTAAGATTTAAGATTTAAGATTTAVGATTTAAGATTTAAGATTTDTTTTAAGATTTTDTTTTTATTTTTDTTTLAGRKRREAPEFRRFKRAAPEGIICTRNIDDSNVCHGDEGSPVFSNKTGVLEFAGVVSSFPDVRKNARCKDGHKVAIMQVGSFEAFIKDQL